jgi:hypothetical protein
MGAVWWLETEGSEGEAHEVDAQEDGFDFLGYHFERGQRWPRKKSLRKFKDTIRAKTKRTSGHSLPMIIADLNRTLRGWFEYFKHSHRRTFPMADGWIRRRLRSLLRKRHRLKGISKCTVPIIGAGRMPSLPSMGLSACSKPMNSPASPLAGKTTNWRAGCGRSASPVRREGEQKPIGSPYPYHLCPREDAPAGRVQGRVRG